MDTNNTVSKPSDTDNDVPSQTKKPSEPTASTPPPSKKKFYIKNDPKFFTSPAYPPQISQKDSISTQRDVYLIPILSNENLTVKSQLTSLCMYPTDYTFKIYDKNQDFFTYVASKNDSISLWLLNIVKTFSLQFTFLKASIYDLKTDEDDPSFLSSSQKATHHSTYITFLKHQSQKFTFL